MKNKAFLLIKFAKRFIIFSDVIDSHLNIFFFKVRDKLSALKSKLILKIFDYSCTKLYIFIYTLVAFL